MSGGDNLHRARLLSNLSITIRSGINSYQIFDVLLSLLASTFKSSFESSLGSKRISSDVTESNGIASRTRRRETRDAIYICWPYITRSRTRPDLLIFLPGGAHFCICAHDEQNPLSLEDSSTRDKI